MNAAQAVQAALVAALAGDAGVISLATGVFDGPPAQAPFPYLAVDGGQVLDWSAKGMSGREHRVAVTAWDDGEVPARLHALMAATEGAIEAMPRTLPGHRIASLVFVRARILRDAGRPWAGMIEYRVRTMAVV